MRISRPKKWLFLSSAIAISTLVGLCAAELAVRYWVYTPAQRAAGPRQLLLHYANGYIDRINNVANGCSLVDSLSAHPFLGYVHNHDPRCIHLVNQQGFIAPTDFPAERDPNYFTVLLSGGSVAEQLGMGRWNDHVSWLARELNSRYVSPNGKPFRVLDGAMGAWALPAQLNVLTEFGNGADAFIVLDGYNEAFGLKNRLMLDAPNTFTMIALYRSPAGSNVADRLEALRKLRRLIYRSPLLSRSFLAYFLFEQSLSPRAIGEETHRLAYDEVGRLFALPGGWSDEKIHAWNFARYIQLERLMHAMSKSMGLRFVHFLQPMPLIGKELTPAESSYEHLISAETYREWIEASRQLRAGGTPSYSLVDIFRDEKGTIYADHIHCAQSRPHGDSRGYEIMAQAMAKDLAKEWKLKPLK